MAALVLGKICATLFREMAGGLVCADAVEAAQYI